MSWLHKKEHFTSEPTPFKYNFEIETLRTALCQGKTLYIKSNALFFDYVEKRYGLPVLTQKFESDFYEWVHTETSLANDHSLLTRTYRIDIEKQIIRGQIVSEDWIQRTRADCRDCTLAKSVEKLAGYPCFQPGTHYGHVRSIQISFLTRDTRPVPHFYAPLFQYKRSRATDSKARRKLFDESNEVL